MKNLRKRYNRRVEMDTLISLKNSYSDFKQSYKVQLERAKGQLKDSMDYGEFYHMPIDRNKMVFYFSNSDQYIERMSRVLEICGEGELEDSYELAIVIGSKFPEDSIPVKLRKFIKKESTKDAKKFFAVAKYIIAGESLPKYFVKRPEQKVIRILENIDRTLSRIDMAQHVISWMLNSSLIVVENEEDKKILKEKYYLSDIYQGDFLIVPSTKPNAGKEILEYIAGEACWKEKIELQKKNILLIMSTWDQGFDEEKYLHLIANAIDYNEYDITLVTKRPENPNSEELLHDLRKEVRILYRRGTFSCTPEEYTDIQYLLKNFDSFEDLEKAYTLLNNEILRRECRRLFGDIQFSKVIYIGKHSAIWTSIAGSIQNAYKIRIETNDLASELQKCDTETKKRAHLNKVKLHDFIFDQIIFSEVSLKDSVLNLGYFNEKKVREFSFPSIIEELAQEELGQYVEYLEKRYFIGRRYQYLHGGMHLDLFPLPKENEKAYIANGTLCDIEKLVMLFSVLATEDENSLLVVYGVSGEELREVGKRYGLDDTKLEVIESGKLEIIKGLKTYLSFFEGYLTDGIEWKYCPIRSAIELLDKKILFYEQGDKKEELEKRFNNLQEYNKYLKDCWSSFLN